MPMKSTKSALFTKLGDRGKQVFNAHKNDETEYSAFGELPEGIENGIAQLVEVKFDEVKPGKENAGKLYFYAAGVVKSPAEHGGVRVAGLRTSITEPLYDTPTRGRKTFDEHFAFVMNELRKLGVDTAATDFDNLEATIQALKETQPHFAFRTWKGQKQTTGPYANQEPRVQHNWNGLRDFTETETSDGLEVQESAPPPSRNGSSLAPPPEPTVATADTQGADQYQLMELVQQAEAGDAEAQNSLKALALEAGVAEADVDNATSWRAVADLINGGGPIAGAQAESGAPEAPAEAEWQPQVEEMYLYKPLDPKTKKPYLDPRTKKERKPVTCEVKAVNVAGKTVDLLNMDDKKTVYKGVKWDDLVTGQ